MTQIQQVSQSVQIYPNPTSDYVKLNIDNGGIGIINVTVYDIVGRKYSRTSYLKSGRVFSEQLDSNKLPLGTYLLDMRQGQERSTKKIIRTQ